MYSFRTILPAVLALLIAPAAAHAGAVTPGQSIQKAIDAAAAGETITIAAGTYSEVVSTAKSVVLRADPGAVLINPAGAKPGPTLHFTGAVDETVTGLTIVSTVGDAVQVDAGKVLLQRDHLITLAKDAAALTTQSNSQASGPVAVTVDSSVLVGAVAAAAKYATPGTLAGKGISIVARHVTAIGNVVADASTASPGSTGITVGFLDSILRGARTATSGQGGATPAPPANPLPLPIPAPPASPTAATTATITAATTRNDVKDTPADAASLFVRPAGFNYHLRADAPVIDKGQITSGESTTDIDGDARTVGNASDYGADEFSNRPPTAQLSTSAPQVRQNVPVTFDASRSSDPEAAAGGGIVSYHWTFGDGSTAVTATPTTTHAFAEKKGYSVTVTVTDRQGARSAASAPVNFTVIDGTPPTLTVSQPAAGQTITLYKKAKKGQRAKRAKVVFFGAAADDTALSSVYLALRPATSAQGTCRWFDGKTKLVGASCTAPLLLTPVMVNGEWRYTLPSKARLPKGAYQLVAIALDASGLGSPIQTIAFRFR